MDRAAVAASIAYFKFLYGGDVAAEAWPGRHGSGWATCTVANLHVGYQSCSMPPRWCARPLFRL